MKVNKLSVTKFGCHRAPLSISFDEGLNIIGGENESGKSTLVRAVQAALFDPYDKKATENLASHGQPEAAWVLLDFDHHGMNHLLEKRFRSFGVSGGGLAQLNSGDATFSNKSADEQLAQLFGVEQRRSNKLSQYDEQGTLGLLICNQEHAGKEPTPNSDVAKTLQQTLGDNLEQMLGGAHGQELLKRLNALKGELLTPTGRPRGQHSEIEKKVSDLCEETESIEGRLAEQDQRRRKLEKLSAELFSMEQGNLVETAKSEAKVADQGLAELKETEQQHDNAIKNLELAKIKHEQAQKEYQERKEQNIKLSTHEADIKELKQSIKELEEQLQATKTSRLEAEKAFEKASEQVNAYHSQLENAEKLEHYQTQSTKLEECKALLHKCTEIQTELDGLQQLIKANPVTDKALSELRAAHTDFERTSAVRDAAATKVVYRTVSESLSWNGQTVSGEGEKLITAAAHLKTTAGLELQITPGGDLEQLDSDVEVAHSTYSKWLKQLGCKNLQAAANQAAERFQQLRKLDIKKTEIGVNAPEGLSAITTEVKELEVLCKSLQASVSKNTEISIADAKSAYKNSLDSQEGCRISLNQKVQAYDQSKEKLSIAKTECDGICKQLEGLRQDIKARFDTESDENLSIRHSQCYQAYEEQKTEKDNINESLQRMDPESIKTTAARLKKSYEQLSERYNKLDKQCVAEKTALHALGDQGFTEELARIKRELNCATVQLNSYKSRAAALQLACETLESHQKQVQDAYRGPVIQRFQHYLKRLFPDVSITINDKLQIESINRNGNSDTFTELSQGTREQIAVMMRLAFADMLVEDGQQPMVILDDALNHCDDERLKVMCELLFEASQCYQILMFVCKHQAYQSCGGYYQAMHELGP